MYKLILLCVACVCVCEGRYEVSDDGPVVSTPMGSILGSWMESRRGRRFEAYRGIPYAEAPVGPLRFQPPKPIEKYRGQVNAAEDGPACPLPAPKEYFVSEDCLTINVYTPDSSQTKQKKPLPVIFFIHAGGFYSMTGRSDLAGPHYLLDKDVVLVTINYRLSSLGFMSTGDALAPGNNGMKDQVVALKWVQKNIASFGGDPNLVTITGCSAGSISVIMHMISPMSKGLFHRAISMSGSAIVKEPTPSHQRHLAVKQAQLLNCPHDNTSVIIDCLKKKTWQEIGDWRGFYEFGFDPVGIWGPVVEPDFGQERFLTMQPLDAIKQKKMHDVPYMVSQTEDEFFWMAFTVTKNDTLRKAMNTEFDRVAPISFMLPRNNSGDATRALKEQYLGDEPLNDDEESGRRLGKLYGDSIIGFPVHRQANLMCRYSSKPVWYYQFSYIGQHSHYEDAITKKPLGAAHHDDLIYLFTLSYRYPAISTTGPDGKVVDQMTALWYNFARYGDPNPRPDTPELGALTWHPMTSSNRWYLRVGDQLSMEKNMIEDRVKIFEKLYPIQYYSSPLPVIFFIHPGGFYSMSGRSDLAGPHYLMDRDVVLVTFNYRLGSLGFLALGTAQAPGNNGYKDQVVALKWVQKNIASFGGDPNLVTLAGVSAGSLSVMLHMISPMTKGLFHRGISISGSPVSKVPSPSHRLDLAIKQAQISNCPTDTPEAIYDCLKTKPWKEIAGSLRGFFEFGFDPLSLWRPVIEPDFGQERFLPIEPIVAIRDGHIHPVPFIISQTTDEFFWKAYSK